MDSGASEKTEITPMNLGEETFEVPAVPSSWVGVSFGRIAQALFGISEQQIHEALQAQEEKAAGLGEILVGMKLLDESQVLQVPSAQLDLPFLAAIDAEAIPDDLINFLPITFAKNRNVVPYGFSENGLLKSLVPIP